MSAIIITTTPYTRTHSHSRTRSRPPHSRAQSQIGTPVNEQTPLLLRPPSPTPSCTSSVSTYSSSSETLLRSPPLKDSISLARFCTVCAGIWSANFVFAFQSTAIPTLAPEIGSWFEHAELAAYLGSGFTLASTAVIPLYGVFMETLGRTFAMVTACGFFGIGTILCAMSNHMYTLIGARIFAGLGGGGLLTVSSVIVTDLVPLRDRGFYQGLMMTIFGSGSMLGGPLAGWLTDRYGWHWSFWVQLPIIVFCAVIVSIFLPTPPIPPTHQSLLSGLASLDWLGSFFLITSVTGLLLGLSFHTSYLEPWSAPIVWGMLLTSVISTGLFFYTETKVKRPVVPLELLKSRHIAAINTCGFFLSLGNQAFMYQIPVYFAVIVNTSTAQAGLIMSLCGGLGLATGSMVAGQYIRSGHSWKYLGPIALFPPIIGAIVAAMWNPTWTWWSYYATVLPCVLGYSTFLCVQLVALISSVDSKIMPKATALMYTTRSLGATLGVSIGGSVQLGALAGDLKKQFKGIDNGNEIISAILHSKSAIRLLPPSLRELALASYSHSLSVVWIFSAIIATITFINSFWIESSEVHKDEEDDQLRKGVGGVVEGGFGEGLGESTIEGETRE
ncbi:multidrug resistance protein fnx1 [Kwoniella mangroviensis CBS 8886]|nr:multidrug resistance protein fnx1 [Kwoniella mangroviensis CBS 8886]